MPKVQKPSEVPDMLVDSEKTRKEIEEKKKDIPAPPICGGSAYSTRRDSASSLATYRGEGLLPSAVMEGNKVRHH